MPKTLDLNQSSQAKFIKSVCIHSLLTFIGHLTAAYRQSRLKRACNRMVENKFVGETTRNWYRKSGSKKIYI